jgi:hypothetical protein
MRNAPVSLHDLKIRASQGEIATWQGREALRLENRLSPSQIDELRS